MSALYNYDSFCPACGTGHIGTPCSAPCVCRCRKCDARLDCRGAREDWAKPLSIAEATKRGMVLTSYGYVPAALSRQSTDTVADEGVSS